MMRVLHGARHMRLLALAISVLLVDQVTKILAQLFLPLCTVPGCDVTEVLGPIGFVRVENAGSAIGFAQGFDLWTLFAAIGLLGVPVLAKRSPDRPMLIGAALLASGALGNLLDRLLAGAVTDFIDIGAPIVFNVADVALLAGCVLMTRSLYRRVSADPLPDARRPARIPEGGA